MEETNISKDPPVDQISAPECTYCATKITNKIKLKKHILSCKKKIAENSPTECFFCAKKLSNKLNLKRHLLICQNKFSEISGPECCFCNKQLLSNSHLKKHLRICKRKIQFMKKEMSGTDCSFCGKRLSSKKLWKRHESVICHKNPNRKKQNEIACECGSVFTRRDNFTAHKKRCTSIQVKKKSCLFTECTAKFHQNVSLMRHLETVHNIEIEPEQNFNFSSEQEFLEWKEKEEARTLSYFPKQNGKIILKSNQRNYYYCQHYGSNRVHRKKGEEARKSNRKSKGHVQGFQCTAKIVEIILRDGHREVVYYPTHNHSLSEENCSRQPVALSVSTLIDNQIALNVPAHEIYQSLRESIPKENFNVTERLIKQRIAKKRNYVRLHSDDITSVCLKVEALEKEKYDPIVIFKPTGIDSVAGYFIDIDPNINVLEKDLFMLGLQTEAQRKLMVGGCRKILIFDTQSITEYENMKLLNILICDDKNKGWAVGHFITNSISSTTVGLFMKAIKNRIVSTQQTLEINCVLTKVDPAIIDGIEYAMETNVQHILCQWHLDNVFKENIRLTCARSKFNDVYTDLKTIISSETIQEFETLVSGFTSKHAMNSKPFVDHFLDNYYPRKEKWAMCYRQNLDHGNVNTTAHAESFYNRLKNVYLIRNRNKRMDDLLTILLTIEQDDFSSRQQENILNGTDGQIMKKHHRDGISLPDECLEEINENLWNIVSHPKKKEKTKSDFHVAKVNTVCNRDLCFDKCFSSSCQNLCSHLYICSCSDNHTVCKHIHKVHSSFRQSDVQNEKNENTVHSEEEIKIITVPEDMLQEDTIVEITVPEDTVLEDDTVDDIVEDVSMPETTSVEEKTVDYFYEKLQSDLFKITQLVNDRVIPDHLLPTVSTAIRDIVTRNSILTETCKNSDIPNPVTIAPNTDFNVHDYYVTFNYVE